MRRMVTMAAVVAMAATLGGCVSPQAEIADRENLLSAAGFIPRPANTPERQAMLQRLPPNRIAQQAHGDAFYYLYPDPTVCFCVYFGNQAAFGRYQAQLQQRRVVSDQLLAAQMYQDSAWNWGPWGPFGW